MPRYHFNLSNNKLTSRITGSPVDTSSEEIAAIDIATVADVHSGWFNMVADKYDPKDPELTDEGKWVLTYPKNDPGLNIAWQKCVSLIFQDRAVHQIKASAPSDNFDTQVIVIYTKGTLQDRARVFRLLEASELTASPASPIKYKTESDTLFDNQNARDGVRIIDRVSHIAEQVSLMEILQKLKTHNYILHGGGKKVNGKTYAQSAGVIVQQIELLLSKKIDFNDKAQIQSAQIECNELISKIQKELVTKTTATKGIWFFGLGGRDKTTAALYSEILTLIDHDNKKSDNLVLQ
jgi:hypothetical protein